eukprot:4014828-Pyramimonas_sp.AAC.1
MVLLRAIPPKPSAIDPDGARTDWNDVGVAQHYQRRQRSDRSQIAGLLKSEGPRSSRGPGTSSRGKN